MNMRFVVKTFLSVQRLEVFLAVLLPFFLILESALANATVYAGGELHGDMRGLVALGRGLFFEVLTYASAKLAKLLWRKGNWFGVGITGLTSLWCIAVSAGNNLGWVLAGGELVGVFSSMGRFLPPAFMTFYEYGLGLLLPLSVGALALVDVSHLVHEALDSSELDNKAVQVSESEMHRTQFLKSQGKQRKKIQQAYDGIAEKRADAYITKVESGDLSFGASNAQPTGVRRVTALPPASGPRLLAGPSSKSSGRP